MTGEHLPTSPGHRRQAAAIGSRIALIIQQEIDRLSKEGLTPEEVFNIIRLAMNGVLTDALIETYIKIQEVKDSEGANHA